MREATPLPELARLIDRHEAGEPVYARLAHALTNATADGEPMAVFVRKGKGYTASEGTVIVRRVVMLEGEV